MGIIKGSRVALTLAIAAGTAGACSSSSKASSSTSVASSATTSANTGTKAAFCSAEVTINKAGASASSAQDFLGVLKANGAALSTLNNDAPAGQIGTEAKALVAAANKAVSSNSADALNSVPRSYSGDIDSYCGVDGNGDPLPAYFAQGKGTQFCTVEQQIQAGTSNAQGPADIVAFLKDHQDLLSQAQASDSNLPEPPKSEVQALVAASQKAVSTNSPDPISTPDVQKASMDASLYCGQDQ